MAKDRREKYLWTAPLAADDQRYPGVSGWYDHSLGDNLYPSLYNQLSGWQPSGHTPVYPGFGAVQPERAVMRGITCRYCGNLYPRDIMETHHNCPTCAGGWGD